MLLVKNFTSTSHLHHVWRRVDDTFFMKNIANVDGGEIHLPSIVEMLFPSSYRGLLLKKHSHEFRKHDLKMKNSTAYARARDEAKIRIYDFYMKLTWLRVLFLRSRKILSEAFPRRRHRREWTLTYPIEIPECPKNRDTRIGELSFSLARGHFDSSRPDVCVTRSQKTKSSRARWQSPSRSTDNALLAENEEGCTITATESRIRLATRFYSTARERRRERKVTLHSLPLPHRPPHHPRWRLVCLLSYLAASRLPLLRSLKLAEYLSCELDLKTPRDELRRGVDGGVFSASASPDLYAS